MAKALNRTTPKQIEHWAKIGEMMEDNPDLPYEFVKQAIIAKAEYAVARSAIRHENFVMTHIATGVAYCYDCSVNHNGDRYVYSKH